MPELPEVETYVRELEPELYGRRITAAHVYWPRIIAAPHADAFPVAVAGLRFVSFGRRGKYMLLGLDNGATLLVHLRMTGKLLVKPAEAEPETHTHVVFELDDGRRLHYTDARKFGRLWLTEDPQSVVGRLGPEPLGEGFCAAALWPRLAGRKAAIKALLLDQRIVAGVGNIYADEALFLAGIHPARPAGSLQPAEVERLCAAVQSVLARGIALQGSTLGGSALQNYRRPGGETGGFQNEFRVYGRAGQPCPTCGAPIERVVIAQRSSHFCPTCQR